MKNIRNVKRRMGRKIKGKCIGTTLLTKGLEFDTVAILNARKFDCPKNLYVALTRFDRLKIEVEKIKTDLEELEQKKLNIRLPKHWHKNKRRKKNLILSKKDLSLRGLSFARTGT